MRNSEHINKMRFNVQPANILIVYGKDVIPCALAGNEVREEVI
jgi:hypothetical protein